MDIEGKPVQEAEVHTVWRNFFLDRVCPNAAAPRRLLPRVRRGAVLSEVELQVRRCKTVNIVTFISIRVLTLILKDVG